MNWGERSLLKLWLAPTETPSSAIFGALDRQAESIACPADEQALAHDHSSRTAGMLAPARMD
jgi:hypothetical protein